jgi:tetratricopeptide (TPR) repeat protein
MVIISIPLKDIVIDPAKPIDLLSLPPEEAVSIIKNSYGFLSSSIEVTIEDNLALIRLKEGKPEEINSALKTFQKAVNEAKKGEYSQAIKHFRTVIDVIPHHVDARRNLAMAYLEAGNITKAKEHLTECLQLDPNNIWTYVLLGNIYAKHENNLDVGVFYYEKGVSINPQDNILLNNYAALKMEQGKVTDAKELFEKALAADPSYPNAYYGLALLHKTMGSPDLALQILDKLYDQPKSQDIRSDTVYQHAHALYLELNKHVAEETYDQLMASIMGQKIRVEEQTGYPIQIVEDNTLEYVSAISQMAWKHNRDKHIIRYRKRIPAMTPHLIAHELEHIVLEQSARNAGRNRVFMTTANTREHAIKVISDHILKLKRQGYPEDKIMKVILEIIHGICNQLFNCPLDMFVEYSLYEKYENMRSSQFVSLNQLHQEALQVLRNKEISRLTPPLIFRANIALNCATALFVDYLFKGGTEYASSYKTSEVFKTGKLFFDIWKGRLDSFQPGDEYEIVDEYANLLKLRNWYEWKNDFPTPAQTPLATKSHFETEPLREASSETFKYCLDALKRFQGKTREEIFKVASEIGLLGTSGIDHTTVGKSYTLKTLPGETFAGLHLLCLMYVGFKIIEPTLDTGLDFKDAYEMALEVHNSSIH